MIFKKLTNTQKVENYILNFGKKPFSSKKISEETEVKLKTVQNILRDFVLLGKIKRIKHDKNGHYYVKTPPQFKDSGDYGSYRPKREKLNIILEYCQNNTVSEIAKNSGIPLRTVHQYLDALYAERCIKIIDIVKSKARRYVKIKDLDKTDFRQMKYYRAKATQMRTMLDLVEKYPEAMNG